VIAIRIPHVGELSRKERDDIKPLFVSKGGAASSKTASASKPNSPKRARKVREKVRDQNGGLAADDLLVLVVGSVQSGASRRHASRQQAQSHPPRNGDLRLRRTAPRGLGAKVFRSPQAFPEGRLSFPVVTNFPMFEYDEADKRWMAAHHPFTSPHDEDMDKLETDPAMVAP